MSGYRVESLEELRQELRDVRDELDENHAIRLHRAISWLRCAETYDDDADIAFVTAWIAINACYSFEGNKILSERTSFQSFIKRLVELDSTKSLYNCLWFNFSSFVRTLIDNQFVFERFWDAQLDASIDWKRSYDGSKSAASHALANNDPITLLSIVMDRLYTLRNQLVHGGATHQSKVNRTQVKDGKKFLFVIAPIMIKIMLNNPDEDWGEIRYPVIS